LTPNAQIKAPTKCDRKMIWGKRLFSGVDYWPYQDRIVQLMLTNPTLHKQFIMVSTKTADRGAIAIYVGVPSEVHFVGFGSFERVQEADLPMIIDALLAGDRTTEEFTSRFRLAHNRRQAGSEA
jgi:hypothetical protein